MSPSVDLARIEAPVPASPGQDDETLMTVLPALGTAMAAEGVDLTAEDAYHRTLDLPAQHVA